MNYNDEQFPNAEILSIMQEEYLKENSVEICEVGEYRQVAELEEILRLLSYCEGFLRWLESKDLDNKEIENLINQTQKDKVIAESCCGRRNLDYRYACDKDFNHNCKNYCKCEMEIIDKIIKLLSLRNSIIDKQCMIKLIGSRMEMLRMIFGRYCK